MRTAPPAGKHKLERASISSLTLNFSFCSKLWRVVCRTSSPPNSLLRSGLQIIQVDRLLGRLIKGSLGTDWIFRPRDSGLAHMVSPLSVRSATIGGVSATVGNQLFCGRVRDPPMVPYTHYWLPDLPLVLTLWTSAATWIEKDWCAGDGTKQVETSYWAVEALRVKMAAL